MRPLKKPLKSSYDVIARERGSTCSHELYDARPCSVANSAQNIRSIHKQYPFAMLPLYSTFRLYSRIHLRRICFTTTVAKYTGYCYEIEARSKDRTTSGLDKLFVEIEKNLSPRRDNVITKLQMKYLRDI